MTPPQNPRDSVGVLDDLLVATIIFDRTHENDNEIHGDMMVLNKDHNISKSFFSALPSTDAASTPTPSVVVVVDLTDDDDDCEDAEQDENRLDKMSMLLCRQSSIKSFVLDDCTVEGNCCNSQGFGIHSEVDNANTDITDAWNMPEDDVVCLGEENLCVPMEPPPRVRHNGEALFDSALCRVIANQTGTAHDDDDDHHSVNSLYPLPASCLENDADSDNNSLDVDLVSLGTIAMDDDDDVTFSMTDFEHCSPTMHTCS